jgi:hypothetical protein
MKTSLLTIIAAATILLAACQVQAGMSEVYFPLNVGNSWTYTNGTEDVTFTIIGTEEIDGFTYYKFNDFFNIYPPPPDGEDKVTIGREALFRYDSEADRVLMIWAEEDVIRYDFRGGEWTGGVSGISRLKQSGITCNVSAGQFLGCINFQFDLFPDEGPDAAAHGEYLAPNIGVIKFVRPGGSITGLPEGARVTFELKSYTIVPEPMTIFLFGLGGLFIRRKRK